MLQSGESETEILLGNKQLLGIFFLVAALLGIAFTGGYMVGRGSSAKKPSADVGAAIDTSGSASETNPAGGETHSVQPDDSIASDRTQDSAGAAQSHNKPARAEEEPLGSRKHKPAARLQAAETEPKLARSAAAPDGSFAPQSGQEFLQVAAVTRDDANAIAKVLGKKGFRAHSVPKPGNPNLYRVIVGPIHDAGDLSSTRDALRKTGFRDVIVQHYQ